MRRLSTDSSALGSVFSPAPQRPHESERAGDERDLRRDDRNRKRELGQHGPGVGGGLAGQCGAHERERVDGSRDAEREERSDRGSARSPRAELGGEGVRELGRGAEALDGVRVGPQMVLRLGEDAPTEPPTDPDVPELAAQLVQVGLDHVTTASTACANAFHSSRSRARYVRPRLVSW